MLTQFSNGLVYDVREDTTDYNTINACGCEDEYGVADMDVTGRLVYDIGAHVGGFGVWLASRGARVVFIEPVPQNAAQIHVNLEANELSGLVMASAVGTRFVSLGPVGDPHEFIANSGAGPRQINCDEVSLNLLIGWYGVPDILKTDCEGGEWAIFDDPAVHECPFIVGEWHPLGERNSRDEIVTLLPYHTIEFTGPVNGPGGFTARLG